jgi:hypothetical protein
MGPSRAALFHPRLQPNMSETEAMDISPVGSTIGDTGIPGLGKAPETSNLVPMVAEELAASPAGGTSDMKVNTSNLQVKSGVRPRDDIPGQVDPNERPLKRARTLDSEVRCNMHYFTRASLNY